MKKLGYKELLLVGITLFSMFFGAGNLIFPPIVGYQAGFEAVPAFIGLALTAVCLPVLGVVAVAKVGGTEELCSKVHPKFATIFTMIVVLSIGPALAIPRTASTSFSMFAFLTDGLAGKALLGIPAPFLAQILFSLLFFGGAYHLAKHPTSFKDVIGKWMTPILLVLIAIMFVAGLFNLHEPAVAPHGPYLNGGLMQGFVDGYQTMDTLAAIIFGLIIAKNVSAYGITDEKAVARETMKAGVVAGVMLCTVYGALAWLGARSSGIIEGATDGTQILSGLCLRFFGPAGALLLAAIFFVACFNVCTGLLSSCAVYFSETFPKFSFLWWLKLFTVASFLVSTMGLSLILKFSVPLLTLLYPVAIAIIIINLLPFKWAANPWVHRVVAVAAFISSIVSLL